MPLASETNPQFSQVSYRGVKKKYFVVPLGLPRFNEIDNYGVVWNGHYVNYFETARHALCRYCDFDMELLSKAGIFLPVSNFEIKISKPIFPRDEISVAVRCSLVDGSRFEFSHLLLVNGEVRASGLVTHIAVDKETVSVAFQLSDEVVRIMKPVSELFSHD
jgi:YbgC/YbaW family acyl-CoA thioester hydrolase